MVQGNRDADGAAALEPTVLSALRRHRVLAGAIVFLALALAVAFSMRGGDSYSATMGLIVRDPRSTEVFGTSNVNDPERYVADQAAVLRSTNVAARVAALAEQEDPPIVLSLDEVTDSTTVSTDPDSSQIAVTFLGEEPAEAITVSNLFLRAYEEVRSDAATADTEAALNQLDSTIAGIDGQLVELTAQIQQQIVAAMGADLEGTIDAALTAVTRAATAGDTQALGAAIDRLNGLVEFNTAVRQSPQIALLVSEQEQLVSRRATLVSRRDEIQVDAQLASSGVVLASPAVEASEVSGGTIRLILAALVLGAAVAAGLAYFLAVRRNEFSDRRQPEAILQVPLVADVPEFPSTGVRLPTVVSPTSVEAEAYRFAAGSLRVLAGAAAPAVVAVVSASVGEGKTTLTANLAIALAEDGLRVAVVDGDMARHGLTSLLLETADSPPGLREVLGGGRIADHVQMIEPWPMGPTFDLLPAGFSEQSDRTMLPGPLAAVFDHLRATHDLVLVDTPPLLQVASASMIVSLADSALAVIADGSPVSRAADLSERLAMSNSKLLGYVYSKNRARPDMPSYYVVPDGAPSKRQAWSRR